MKKTRIALAITASMIAATPAMATNGDNLIGLGAQSRALGGTGVAAFYGSENALANPALLAKAKGNEISFGGTLFKPSVKSGSNIQSNLNSNMGGYLQSGSVPNPPVNNSVVMHDSAADTNVIPEVSIVNPISDNLSFGIGMFGSAGMGVDYSDYNDLFNAQSNLQIMKFAPSLSYKTKNFGFGFAPVLQYGALDINFRSQVHDGQTSATDPNGQPVYLTSTTGTPTTGRQNGNANTPAGSVTTFPMTVGSNGQPQPNSPLMQTVGSGVTSDLGWGYNAGAYMDMGNLTVGLAYQSAIDMKYKGQISTAGKAFGLNFSDNLEQPAELSLGLAYKMGKITLTGDYKQIKWSEAKGYKDFKWDDQTVIALGAKYQGKGFWLGAGYNKADNPIKDLNNTPAANTQAAQMQAYANGATNMFNNLFFPATVESHITFGGGYSLSKTVSIDAAVVMASENKTSVDTSAVSSAFFTDYTGKQAGIPSTSTTKHSQIGYTVSVRYDF